MTITWLRTPDENFANLEGYPFKPNYLEIPFEGQQVRMHYVDERPADGKWSGETIVLLHGQPTWSYLYRKMIPLLLAAGHRVIAPDLIGFGKSDKPSRPHDISYGRQEEWMRAALFDVLDLKDVNLFCQDWGGLIGLRLVAFHPERFMRVVISNTGLPVGGKDSNFTPGDAPRKTMMLVGVKIWQQVAKRITAKMIGGLCGKLCRHINLTDAEKAGYCAPFPSKEFLSGPRAMPQHIRPIQQQSRPNAVVKHGIGWLSLTSHFYVRSAIRTMQRGCSRSASIFKSKCLVRRVSGTAQLCRPGITCRKTNLNKPSRPSST